MKMDEKKKDEKGPKGQWTIAEKSCENVQTPVLRMAEQF